MDSRAKRAKVVFGGYPHEKPFTDVGLLLAERAELSGRDRLRLLFPKDVILGFGLRFLLHLRCDDGLIRLLRGQVLPGG